MAAYRAVLFDFDDTLVDTGPGKVEAYRRVAKILSSELDGKADVAQLVGAIAQISEEMNMRQQYSRDEWWRILARRMGFELSRHLELRATVAYWSSFKNNTRLYPDTLVVLEALRREGVPIGVVTDTDGWRGIKRWRLVSSPIFGYFDAVVVAGEDTRRTKPDPKPFVVCAQRLGVEPAEALFVGDKPYTDVLGAKSAGMKAALIKRRSWRDLMGADFVLGSLSELLGIVL